jgi:hypothetical protein
MQHEPELNDLAALAEGRLTGADRDRTLAHVAECRECRDVLALLARRASAPSSAAWWQRPAVWMPVAAMLAVASVAVLLVRGPGGATLSDGGPPDSGSTRPAGDRALPAPPANPAPPVAPDATPTPPPPPASDDLLRRRSSTRQVDGKAFQLVAGEWIDSSYDPAALLPVVEINTPSARRELLTRVPALEPFAALGDRVIVVFQENVYRFDTEQR